MKEKIERVLCLFVRLFHCPTVLPLNAFHMTGLDHFSTRLGHSRIDAMGMGRDSCCIIMSSLFFFSLKFHVS